MNNYQIQSQKKQQENKYGFIEVIFGPMFSGKTTQLMRKLRRYEHAKKKCLAISFEDDKRYTQQQQMCTHDRSKYKAIRTRSLKQILLTAQNFQVVGIDQGQFFKDVVQVAQILANKGVIVLVAALDSTYQRKAFNDVINLVPLAQRITKLSAICVKCSKKAFFTQRIANDFSHKQKEKIQLVGGSEIYQAVCRKCYNQGRQNNLETKINKITNKQKNQQSTILINGSQNNQIEGKSEKSLEDSSSSTQNELNIF